LREAAIIEVADTSAVGEVRRVAAAAGRTIGLAEETADRVALVVTEMATNIVKHAAPGLFLVGRDDDAGDTLELLALDRGPGIADMAKAMSDGHSTSGTPGTGLGAVSRHSDLFQIYSQPQHGTAVLARFKGASETKLQPAREAAVSIPVHGEDVNGDSWGAKSVDGVRSVIVVDGLGHGQLAHDAAVAACEAFKSAKGRAAEAITAVHDALRSTRGAAVAIAELDGNTLRYCGVGNIAAIIVDPSARRSAVSLHGIVGHQMREAREFTYPWSRDSTLIMHSDGLSARWDLDTYPGLLSRDAVLIAAVLWKDHRRQNDDSTVVVIQPRS
jgi:anti-sigma regulatory factor (Ser/Thr protein kinase)